MDGSPSHRGGGSAPHGVAAFNDLPSEIGVTPGAASRSSTARTSSRTLREKPIISRGEHLPVDAEGADRHRVARFYEHGGLDVRLHRAMVSNSRAVKSRALDHHAQYVRSRCRRTLFGAKTGRRKDAVAKTYTRKLQELKYALDGRKHQGATSPLITLY